MDCPFRGSYVALPTPFKGEDVDLETLGKLIDRQAEAGSAGVVVTGTSGECCTLTDYERRTVIHDSVERARGRMHVIAGVGTNSTRTTVELTRFAAASGVDGVLVVTPYYSRPSRRGLINHFTAVSDSVGIPLMLYNVPARTGVDLLPDAVAELHEKCDNVVAIKEASHSGARGRDVRRASEIALFAGDDSLIAEFMSMGAWGAVNVVGNIAPEQVVELIRVGAPDGDTKRTGELVEFLAPIVRDLAIETNPVPLKAALENMQLCSGDVRGPLAPMEERNLERLEATLSEAGLV